jgi:hypothetical protein
MFLTRGLFLAVIPQKIMSVLEKSDEIRKNLNHREKFSYQMWCIFSPTSHI